MISVSTPNLQNLSFFPEKDKHRNKGESDSKPDANEDIFCFEANKSIPQHLRESILEDGGVEPFLIVKVLEKSLERAASSEFSAKTDYVNGNKNKTDSETNSSLQINTIETILEI